MNELQIFESADFGRVRMIEIDGEAWFVGKDVATALGYSNTKDALSRHVDADDKRGSRFTTPSGEQEMTVINESGLYALIFGSKLENAKKFKHWVTSEVLPAIRKTGGYKMPQTTGEKIVLLAQGYTELQQEINEVRADVHQLKMDLPILPIEADRITTAVKIRRRTETKVCVRGYIKTFTARSNITLAYSRISPLNVHSAILRLK